MKKDKLKKLKEQDVKLFEAIVNNSLDKSIAKLKLTLYDNSRFIFSKYNGFEPIKIGYFRGNKTKDYNKPNITIEQQNRTLDKYKKKIMQYDLNGYRA